MSSQKASLPVNEALKLIALGGIVVSTLVAPGIGVAYLKLSKSWRKYRRKDIGQVVKRLHKRELLTVSEQNGETLLVISDKGREKLIRSNFDNMKHLQKRDGKLRLVIFDIPNIQRKNRDMFRIKLKELGFIQLQESVFVSPFECQKEIEFITQYLRIPQYVSLLKIDKFELGDDAEFKHGNNFTLEHRFVADPISIKQAL